MTEAGNSGVFRKLEEREVLKLQLKWETQCYYVQLCGTDEGAAGLQASPWVKTATILWQPAQQAAYMAGSAQALHGQSCPDHTSGDLVAAY